MIAEGLEWLGNWWQSRATGLTTARAGAEQTHPRAAVAEAEIAASRLRVAAWDVAQHAERGATKGLLLERLASASTSTTERTT